MPASKPQNIDEYISAFPADIQALLQSIRATVRKAAPEAEEDMRYGMPTFRWHGNVLYFAAYRNHIGVYPAPRENEAFREELAQYEGAKGTLRLPLDRPIPHDLIARIVRFRMKANRESAAAKRAKK